MPIYHNLTRSEDRTDLAKLLVSSEGKSITITFSNGSVMTLPEGWSSAFDLVPAAEISVRLPQSDETCVIEQDEIVRVNDLESGELVWETQRGKLAWASHPPSTKIRLIAALLLPLLIAGILHYTFDWNFFGDWDGIIFASVFLGAVILIRFFPDKVEIV